MTNALTEEALYELLSLDCRVDSVGTLRYYNAQGLPHRKFGPAAVYTSGRLEWYQTGQRHRMDGPAIVCTDGYRVWFQNGLRHRLDGPAIKYEDGTDVWYQNGQRHRLDGPALECPDGTRAWHINGIELTEAAWLQAVARMENA